MDSTDPASQAFVKAYTAEYGQKPDALSVLGYDAARVLVDAIERAGSLEPEKIRAELETTRNFKGVSGDTTLNETHDAVKSAVIIEMQDGKQVYKTSVNP